MKFTLLFILFSSTAFAISNQDLETACLETGKAKIAEQAEAYGCVVDANEAKVQEVDNRWYNPSKYIWYQAPSQCQDNDHLTVLVQYANGSCR